MCFNKFALIDGVVRVFSGVIDGLSVLVFVVFVYVVVFVSYWHLILSASVFYMLRSSFAV